MNKGTVEGLSQASTPPTHEDEFLRSIRHSNEVFSAFKAQAWGRTMQERLLDAQGKLRSFAEWKKEVEPISRHHVGAWLRTEYDTAVIRAHQAAEWLEFERNKDILPNLQWMPTASPSPEAGHRLFWEKPLILPVDDPFWSEHRPGDRWNCKCSLDATDDDPRPLDPSEQATAKRPEHSAQPGLDGNPAYKGLITDSHPYYPKSCAVCPHYKAVNLKAWLKKKVVGRVKECHSCPYMSEAMGKAKYEQNYKEYQRLKEDPNYRDVEFDPTTGGVKATHIEHNFDHLKGKYEKYVQDAGFQEGHSVIFGKEDHTKQNQRNTEGLWDGRHFEIAGAETFTANNIRNALKHCAKKPDAEVAVIFFPNGFDPRNFEEALKKYEGLRGSSQHRDFHRIYLIREIDGKPQIFKVLNADDAKVIALASSNGNGGRVPTGIKRSARRNKDTQTI